MFEQLALFMSLKGDLTSISIEQRNEVSAPSSIVLNVKKLGFGITGAQPLDTGLLPDAHPLHSSQPKQFSLKKN